MSRFDDRLADYVDVKERIRLLYEKHPDARLVTAKVKLTADPDRVWVKALAYRTPDDPHPGVGWSWMLLPGTTPYTRGSEIENAETSAWGRAIGSLGIGIDKSIASADEVRNKQDGEESGEVVAGGEKIEMLGRITKTGTLVKGTAVQYRGQWREAPEGWSIGFRFRLSGEDRDIPQVLITGVIGSAIHTASSELLGAKVTLKGHLYNVKPKKGDSFYRLIVGDHPDYDFIETADVRIPALPPSEPPAGVENQPDGSPIMPEEAYDAAERAAHRAAAALVGAESVPLPFDMDEVDREAGVA